MRALKLKAQGSLTKKLPVSCQPGVRQSKYFPLTATTSRHAFAASLTPLPPCSWVGRWVGFWVAKYPKYPFLCVVACCSPPPTIKPIPTGTLEYLQIRNSNNCGEVNPTRPVSVFVGSFEMLPP